jgi:hypothetical protein
MLEDASEPEQGCGLDFGIQVGGFTGGHGTAVVFHDGERFAKINYSANRFVDGLACVLAVIAFFLPFAMTVACFGSLPHFIQKLLNPFHPAAGNLWLWGVAITCLAGLAYPFSLFVLLCSRSRVRIRTTSLSAHYPCDVDIKEARSLSPRKVKADVAINGRHEGVVRGLGRSLLTFRGNEGCDISFVSVKDQQCGRETVVSGLFVLIGSLFNVLAVPSRRRLQQKWAIEEAGHSLGWLEYRRSMPEQYQIRLDENGAERALEVVAVALLLARPASSGTVESYEELH